MALIQFGDIVTGMQGKCGGAVYSRNRYGAYKKNLTVPVNPNTARQQVVRSCMAFLAARWAQDLTQAQRDAWDLYGSSTAVLNRLGQQMFLSGYNHYLGSNVVRKMMAHAIIDDGPTDFLLPAHDPTLAITASEATQQITTTFDNTMAWSTETGAYIYLFQGRPQNAQRNFFGGPWRQFGWVTGIDPGGAASPDVSAVAFAIAELQHQWIYARISRADGRLSPPFRADIYTGA